MTIEDVLFHSLGLIAVISALLVVFVRSPVYSALFLALCMSVLGAMFFTLQAYFVAVAQITVYAGAVMVLFVMVVMLFDLKRETEEILKFSPVTLAKVLATALLCGFLVGTGWLGVSVLKENFATQVASGAAPGSPARPVISEHHKKAGGENPDEDLTAAEDAKLVDKDPGEKGASAPEEFGNTVSLSRVLFSKFVFAFEAVSALLLVAIVGAVALAKSKGGTHHVT